MRQVSVIIPSYARPDALREVLPTYLAEPEVAEIIVVDDGSPAPVLLRDIAPGVEPEAAPTLRVIRHPRSLGLTAARNTGLAHASAPWVFMGEDDLELESGHLATLLDGARRHDADIVAGRVLQQWGQDCIDATDERLRAAGVPLFDREAVTVQSSAAIEDVEVPFCHAIVLVRTAVAREHRYSTRLGGPSFMREDQEFALRLRRAGHRMWLIAGARSLHWSHERTSGGGTRVYRSPGVQASSALLNTWMVLDEYHDLVAPFFGLRRHQLLRRAMGRTGYLESKRYLQARSGAMRALTQGVRRARGVLGI